MAVRWDLAHPLSSTSVLVLLAERGGDISPPTVLRWVQTFGPLLAGELRKYRRRPGTTWYVDEVVFFRDGGKEKRYLYRAVDEHGQVVDILFREQRDTEAANAFFRRVLGRAGTAPTMVVRDHHQPDVPAVQEVFPGTRHVRTGWHRARGETTKPIARSHVPTRDRLRSSRGLKPLQTGQRFFEGFEALQALDRGHIHLGPLIPGDESAAPTPHAHVRAVVRALHTRGAGLRRAA
jgi:putative transposase